MDATAQRLPAVRARLARFPWDTLVVAVVAFGPLLLTKQGLLADDTKIYLYLDPAHLMKVASSLWNLDVGFGTVTHQTIGYLFPMGPFFLLAKTLGISAWVAQRLWMGLLLFSAAIGVRRCAQEMGLSRWAGWVAAAPYMLSPFILVNLDRTSALLMPWAGLGWMMLFTIRAARRGDWRNPALFALVVLAVGGINATSILMVGFAPLVFLIYAGWTREVSWRRVGSVMWRIGSLSLLVSIWWLAGLWAEGKYGINVLRFTESFATVSTTSTSSEVFRGLGYWYFYGWDGLQPWTLPSLTYMSGKIVPTMSFIVPTVGFIAALCIRWRYRLFAVLTAFVGIVVAVGAYPLSEPTPIGWIVKWLTAHTTVALAMRSSNRVLPIAILALALLSGAAFEALRAKSQRLAWWGSVAFLAIVALALLPLFEGRVIASNLTMPSTLPSYVTEAAADLNKGPSTSTVMGLPGFDFAYTRFGSYNDSLWPGILDRPWLSSQVAPEGEAATIVMMRGLDSTIQDGINDSSSIAPIARLFNAGSVLMQMNGQYERYSNPLPAYLWQLVNPAPSGLTLEKTYGPTVNVNVINGPYINEQVLGLPIGFVMPQSLAVFSVSNPRTLVRTESLQSPQLVAGNGEGLVTMAAMGMLNNQRTILFDASLKRSAVRGLAGSSGAWLVVTDSNQKRLDEFGTLAATAGYVQQAHESPLVAVPDQQSLSMFSNPPPDSQTVALMRGLADVGASSYGNIITNNPEAQPYKAVDANLDTSWETSAFSPAIGQFFQMTAYRSHPISQFQLVQTQSLTDNRWITKIGISVDGGPQIVRSLSVDSRGRIGQAVKIPPTHGRTIRVTILDVTGHDNIATLAQASSVGIAEIEVPGFGPVTRGLLMPSSLLRAAGHAAATDDLSIVVNRLRAATHPTRIDPELSLLRYFDLPYPRSFTVAGYANLNAAISDEQLNYLLDRHAGPGVSVSSTQGTRRLTGSLTSSSWSAFDDNSQTAWMPEFHTGAGEWVRANLTAPATLSHFTMKIINDGYHMIPTAMTVSNGTTTEAFNVPATMATATGTLNTEQTFSLHIPPITGTSFTFAVTKVKTVTVIDRVSGAPNFPPVGIVDIKMPGVNPGVTPANFDSGCRLNLLNIDGIAVPIRVRGTSADALAQNRLSFASCTKAQVVLVRGRHSLSSQVGYYTGININNVVLNSSGVNPGPTVSADSLAAHWYGRTVVRANVPASMAGREIVLAQSYALGWHAVLNGHDLGTPTLVDGASMGWLLPMNLKGTEPIAFIWEPQNVIVSALVISGLGVLLALLFVAFNWPRRRRGTAASVDDLPDHHPSWAGLDGQLRATPTVLFVTATLVALAVSLYAVPVVLVTAWLWWKWPSLGRWVAAASIALLAVGIAITIVATQLKYPHDITWPARVQWSNSLVWCALALWTLVVVATSYIGHHSHGSVPREAPPIGASAPPSVFDEYVSASQGSIVGAPRPVWITPTAQSLFTDDGAAHPALTPVEEHAPVEGDIDTASDMMSSVGPIAAPLVVEGTRRRGLNVPEPLVPFDEEDLENQPTLIPPTGIRRTTFLLRMGWKLRHDPDEWQSVVSYDLIHQVVGKTPIFNRRVLDITDAESNHVEGLLLRGAQVTAIRRDIPPSRRTPNVDVDDPTHTSPGLTFTPEHIPAGNGEFDLVFASNVFSSVADASTLLDEIIRVTRPGGAIYIQNRTWYSWWGGRETSPWHLISGEYARRRYTKRHGHEPFNRLGVNFFKLRPGSLMKALHAHPELVVFIAGPRILPSGWGWMVKVPLLRNFLVQDLLVVAERRR